MLNGGLPFASAGPAALIWPGSGGKFKEGRIGERLPFLFNFLVRFYIPRGAFLEVAYERRTAESSSDQDCCYFGGKGFLEGEEERKSERERERVKDGPESVKDWFFLILELKRVPDELNLSSHVYFLRSYSPLSHLFFFLFRFDAYATNGIDEVITWVNLVHVYVNLGGVEVFVMCAAW